MTSRAHILKAIRENLGQAPSPELPPVPVVWPTTSATPSELCKRFVEELRAVHGEPIVVQSCDDAAAHLRELANAAGWHQALVLDRPLAREVVAKADLGWETTLVPDDPQPRDLAAFPVAIIQANYLLADTGSCVVVCGRAGERISCYLPPTCVVVAEASRLREHMPAVWNELVKRAENPDCRGEFVIITGPSRTADIEKILILGVHGPKRLIVLVVG